MLPQSGARLETVRLISQQVVSIATGRHVVMVAIGGRVVAVREGKGGEVRGGKRERGEGGWVYRKRWQTINRAYQEPAAESCGLMAPCQIHPLQTHSVCSVCM